MARAVFILAAIGCLGSLLAADNTRRENYSYGTGFFVHPDGFLLTNQHVIENAKEVVVVTSEGRTLPARVIREDAYKDLALIAILAPHDYRRYCIFGGWDQSKDNYAYGWMI